MEFLIANTPNTRNGEIRSRRVDGNRNRLLCGRQEGREGGKEIGKITEEEEK